MSRLAMLFVAVGAGIAAMALGGCGGSGSAVPVHEQEAGSEEGGASEAEREQAERAQAAKLVPVGDRVAYYQLTTTSGFLRSTLEVERSGGTPATVERGELDSAVKRLQQITPRDSGLRTVQRKMLPIASQALAGVNAKRAAKLTRQLDRLNANLSRFLSRRPAQAVLVPD